MTDRERPLNDRGERDAPEMGKRIVDHGIRPSLIISSPAVRAWTTAKIIAQQIGYPIEFLHRESDLYLASLNDLLQTVVSQDNGFNNLMVVGHNPGISDFANYLSPGVTNSMPTAAVVSVEIEIDDWNLFEQPPTKLIAYDYPKLKA